MYGLLAFILIAALAMAVLGADLHDRDVSVGMILMFSVALGLLFLNIYSANANTALGILFGSVLGTSAGQAQLTAIIS